MTQHVTIEVPDEIDLTTSAFTLVERHQDYADLPRWAAFVYDGQGELIEEIGEDTSLLRLLGDVKYLVRMHTSLAHSRRTSHRGVR